MLTRVGVLVSLGLVAWWAGEDLLQPLGGIPVTCVAATTGAALLWKIAKPTWRSRFAWAFSSIAVAAGAHFAANSLAVDAFNDCVKRGEDVRVALGRFHAERGHYPARLEELHGFNLPGRLWLHGNLLHYSANESGYDLWFRDWLVSFDASESHGFGAHK
jgi:hypothetical protein